MKLVLGLLMALPHTLAAQAVQGVVARANSDERLDGATVTLLPVSPDAPELEVILSGPDGAFAFDAGISGQYVLQVRALGYRPQFAIIDLASDQVLAIRVNLAPMAIMLDAITVYGLEAATEGQREFWSRRDLPWNHGFVHTEFEKLGAHEISEVLEFGVLGGRRLARCAMIYRDGIKLSRDHWELDDTSLDWVYGIEVYRDYYDIPLRYRDPFDGGGGCGAILLWSHEVGKGR
jgi:hypothetical protein